MNMKHSDAYIVDQMHFPIESWVEVLQTQDIFAIMSSSPADGLNTPGARFGLVLFVAVGFDLLRCRRGRHIGAVRKAWKGVVGGSGTDIQEREIVQLLGPSGQLKSERDQSRSLCPS